MEKTKNRKIFGIFVVLLTIVLMASVVGYVVYAAILEQKVDFGGNVSFDAQGINAKVTATDWEGCTINGFEFDSAETGRDELLQTITYSTTKGEDDSSETEGSWEGLTVKITDTTDGTATITFTVQNTSSSDTIAVGAEDVSTDDLTITCQSSDASTPFSVTAGETETFTITFTLNSNYSLSTTSFSMPITLELEVAKSLTINLNSYAASGCYDSFYVSVDDVVVMSPAIGIDTYTTSFYGSVSVSFYGTSYDTEEKISAQAAAAAGYTFTASTDTGLSGSITFGNANSDKKITFEITEDTVFTVSYSYSGGI